MYIDINIEWLMEEQIEGVVENKEKENEQKEREREEWWRRRMQWMEDRELQVMLIENQSRQYKSQVFEKGTGVDIYIDGCRFLGDFTGVSKVEV